MLPYSGHIRTAYRLHCSRRRNFSGLFLPFYYTLCVSPVIVISNGYGVVSIENYCLGKTRNGTNSLCVCVQRCLNRLVPCSIFLAVLA